MVDQLTSNEMKDAVLIRGQVKAAKEIKSSSTRVHRRQRLGHLRELTRRKLICDNAARLYRLGPTPGIVKDRHLGTDVMATVVKFKSAGVKVRYGPLISVGFSRKEK